MQAGKAEQIDTQWVSFCSSQLTTCSSFCNLQLTTCNSFCCSQLTTCSSFCSSQLTTCFSFCSSQLTTQQAMWSVARRTSGTNWCPVGRFLRFTAHKVMPSWVDFCGSQLRRWRPVSQFLWFTTQQQVSFCSSQFRKWHPVSQFLWFTTQQWVSFCSSQLTKWCPVSRFLWVTTDKMMPSQSVCVVHNSACSRLRAELQEGQVEQSDAQLSCCCQFSVWTTACLAVLTSQSMIEVVAVNSACELQRVWQCWHLSRWQKLLLSA